MWQHVPLVVFCFLFTWMAYLCLLSIDRLEEMRNYLLYGTTSAVIFFGGATAILLYKIVHLSPADFGNYRCLLFVAFAFVCGLSFFRVRDLLAIRGLAVLILFLCDSVLDSVYCKTFFLHNVFVCLVYFVIILSIAIGAMPYILRDCVDKILANDKLAKLIGVGCFIFTLISLWVTVII
jgi:hypothetical protein